MRNKKAEVLMHACDIAPHTCEAFVEIGCIREDHEVPTDGYSTIYLARFCEEKGRPFSSVDIELSNIDKARTTLDREGLKMVELVHCDGKQFLEQWNIHERGRIALMYLDSHRDPRYSLEQFNVAREKLAAHAVVVIDDAHTYDGHEHGKATYLIDLFRRESITCIILPTEPGFRMAIAKMTR